MNTYSNLYPSSLYLLGLCSILWYVAWELVVHESPASHPTVSEEEKKYIEKSIAESGDASQVKLSSSSELFNSKHCVFRSNQCYYKV